MLRFLIDPSDRFIAKKNKNILGTLFMYLL